MPETSSNGHYMMVLKPFQLQLPITLVMEEISNYFFQLNNGNGCNELRSECQIDSDIFQE